MNLKPKSNNSSNNKNDSTFAPVTSTPPASCIMNGYDECRHDPRLTPDGSEHVCTKCGAVLSPAATEETATTAVQTQQPQETTKSKINLYVSHQLGSVEAATTNARLQEMLSLSDSRSLKIARNGPGPASASRYLSQFSNACDRLDMSPVEAESAWQVFCKVYRQLCTTRPRVISTVEAALYSICCYCNTVDEYEAASVVSSSFGTKQTRMRDLYHLRIIVSTRVDGLPPVLPGGRMRLTTSAMWMHGTIARRFLSSSNNGAMPRQQRPMLLTPVTCVIRTQVASHKMSKNCGGGR
ncbi:MAG TPA: hypothetical protein VF172_08400 [Nitrososphaera sp.]